LLKVTLCRIFGPSYSRFSVPPPGKVPLARTFWPFPTPPSVNKPRGKREAGFPVPRRPRCGVFVNCHIFLPILENKLLRLRRGIPYRFCDFPQNRKKTGKPCAFDGFFTAIVVFVSFFFLMTWKGPFSGFFPGLRKWGRLYHRWVSGERATWKGVGLGG